MKAMKIFITSTVFLLTGILFAQGLDQRCTQMGESACVDWDRGVVMAEGLGAPASSAKKHRTEECHCSPCSKTGRGKEHAGNDKGHQPQFQHQHA